MQNNFESLNNLEDHIRKSSVVQERTGLVAVYMYKQFLDFQKSTHNTAETFIKITDIMEQVAESMKQSFSVRNVPNNVYVNVDPTKTVATINILWHTISFTNRFNLAPKAIPREGQPPLFCGRIFALNGDYGTLMKDAKEPDEQMRVLLDNEIASLYIPAEKNQSLIFSIRHKLNQEHFLSHVDAPRDFLLKVIEIICAGGQFHEQK